MQVDGVRTKDGKWVSGQWEGTWESWCTALNLVCVEPTKLEAINAVRSAIAEHNKPKRKKTQHGTQS